jgi:uncharacterized membrane protein HdeD (DUF308 family)
MHWFKKNWYLILGGFFLFWALSSHPNSYFQFLRWFVSIAAAYTAYKSSTDVNKTWAWIFGIIAVVFNPIVPFYMAKDTWQLIDLIAGVIFIIKAFINKKMGNDVSGKLNN